MDWPISILSALEMAAAGIVAGTTVAGLVWWILARKIRDEFVPIPQFEKRFEKADLRFEKAEVRLDSAEEKLNALMRLMEIMPTAAQINQILISLESVRGDMRAMQEKADGQGRLLDKVDRGVDRLTAHQLSKEKA